MLKNTLITLISLTVATVLSLLFVHFGNGTTSVAIIYILAVVFVARYSDGYLPGIVASFIGVICVNYVFTYPYMHLNFTMAGYPVTFAGMIIISTLISTMTSHLKLQSKIINEREKLLMEAEKEAMRANLLRAISHDLRTPLTGMIGASSTYLENQDSLSREEKEKLVQNIYDDSNWLLHMVENLLTITRIKTNVTPIHKTSELLEEVVGEAVQRFRARFPQAQVQVEIPDELILISVDATLIEQVLINLLENAFFHGDPSSPIELKVSEEKGQTVFRVIDYGPGIDEALLPHIFDGSPSSPGTGGDSRKGMGIGLSICKTIITAHGGTINASNHKNGAQFTFCLPAQEEENHES